MRVLRHREPANLPDVTQPVSSRAGLDSGPLALHTVLLTTGLYFPAVVPFCAERDPVPRASPNSHTGRP